MVRSVARLAGLAFVLAVAGGVASAVAAARFKRVAPPLPDPDANEIDVAFVMDGASFASTAPAFRGGRVISWYAGADIDLRRATLDPAGAAIEVRTVFAGTRVVVAPGVPVHVSGPAVFGGRMSNLGGGTAADGPGLDITGFTVFGGLQVLAADPDEELVDWSARPEPDRPEALARDDGDQATTAPAGDLPSEAGAVGS